MPSAGLPEDNTHADDVTSTRMFWPELASVRAAHLRRKVRLSEQNSNADGRANDRELCARKMNPYFSLQITLMITVFKMYHLCINWVI